MGAKDIRSIDEVKGFGGHVDPNTGKSSGLRSPSQQSHTTHWRNRQQGKDVPDARRSKFKYGGAKGSTTGAHQGEPPEHFAKNQDPQLAMTPSARMSSRARALELRGQGKRANKIRAVMNRPSMAESKDETVIGITGKPVPAPRTAIQQYKLEKKRRETKHLGPNIGGVPYKPSPKYYVPSTGGTNPRARTFREFVEIAEAVSDADRRLAQSGILSRRADELQKEIDAVTSGKKPTQTTTKKRKVTKQTFIDRSNASVREESEINEAPFQIYGPDPHGPSDAEPQPLGKPYQNKKRARRRADELDDKIGGYRHFVRKVDEAKVDERLPEHERATARDKRSEFAGLPGSGTRRARRIAHRERDDRNKDLADLRKGKKKDSAYHSYLP